MTCKSALKGKAQTVLGLVDADELGVTLIHEHLLIDSSQASFVEPTAASEKALAYEPVTLENLWWVRYNYTSNLDNQRLLDEQIAIKETLLCKQVGCDTIVDVTNIGLARDPAGLVCISRATGLNIIMGAGYYVGVTHPAWMDAATEEEIAEKIIRDVTVGVEDTGTRAGIIGEIGCSWPWTKNERKVVVAAAHAQQRTGAPLMIHPGRHETAPLEIIEVLRDAGADLSHTVICHIENRIFNFADLHKVLESGCYVAYDTFGSESAYYPMSPIDAPNDGQRLNQIIKLIAEGYLNQILMSQDICVKVRLTRYGGHGYAHILRNVVPQMQRKGISEQHIKTILVDNPKRMLRFT